MTPPPPLLCRASSLPEFLRAPLPAFLFVLSLLPLPAPPAGAQTRAQTQKKLVCPWLTAGTAAATLGGPVVVVVHLEGDPDQPLGTCTFTLQQSPTPSVLEIAVAATPFEPLCPANSPKLSGIGNQATLCRLASDPTHPPTGALAGNSAQVRYLLTSRVRDLFVRATLSLPSPVAQPDPKQPDNLQQRLQAIAEQIAGNIF